MKLHEWLAICFYWAQPAYNARLMAAAPEMLAALEIAVDIIRRYANNNKRIEGYSKIEDAIKLAKNG